MEYNVRNSFKKMVCSAVRILIDTQGIAVMLSFLFACLILYKRMILHIVIHIKIEASEWNAPLQTK